MKRSQIWAMSLLLCGCGAAAAGDRSLAEDAGARVLTPCEQLVANSCDAPDAPGACDTTGSCQAARLTARYEPAKCDASLQETTTFSPCFQEQDAGTGAVNADAHPQCTALVKHVCQNVGTQDCSASEACALAQDVAAGLDDEACRQALGDQTSFPQCPPADT